jgi:inosine-uridine nucleoside N-ribohydrolase
VRSLVAGKGAGSMASDQLQRVIIDTDPGVDDAQAILFALRLGAFQIDAVTTVFGNCAVTTATRNARTLLELGKVDRVPVFMGAGEPLIRRPRPFATMVHGDDGFGNFPTPEPAYPLSQGYAAAEMARLVADNSGEITILALGTLTNVAMAMRLDPTFVNRVRRIICMGGIVRGHGNVSAVATANMINDPDAARIVFESGADVTMVGQDVTRHVRIEPKLIKAIRDADSALARFIGKITPVYEHAYSSKLEPHLAGFPVHDLLVMAYAVRPELFDTERLLVKIETTGTETLGMTVADFRHEPPEDPNVTVCVKAKAQEILDWYRQVIIGS